ncbi:hypothetical protein [Bacillus cereus group sp. TH260-2LC]|uniref:hypothetical protein n=1 Tax=unclassified Bacillus cereus group TaxID=2750818 RepID=UPI0022E557E8|nr:hypothetical protein [Bacillus cereus group sp. TH260-2LC]
MCDRIKNNEVAREQRFINTISAQRIEWINTIRNEFVQFNTLVNAIMYYPDVSTTKRESESDLLKDLKNIEEVKNRIVLLLNPREIFSDTLVTYLDEMIDIILLDSPILEKYSICKNEVIYIQQVILKSEWKRIKNETEIGKQLNEEETKRIFIDVAKEIDKVKYKKIFAKHL